MHQKLTSALAATALLLAGGLLTATPAQAGSTDAAAQSRVVIADRDRTTAATVETVSIDPFVRMLRLTGNPNQIWQLRDAGPVGGTRIVSEASGNCLQISPASDPEGSFVVQLPCGGVGADTWRIEPTEQFALVRIVNVSTDLCLTQPPPVGIDTRLLVTSCVADDLLHDQLFRLLPVV